MLRLTSTIASIPRFMAMPRGACIALALIASTFAGCGAGGGGGGSDPTLAITTATVSDATLLSPYPAQQLQAAAATGQVSWSVTGGALPPGIGLSSVGVLNGTPTAIGDFPFTVSATDDALTVSRNFSIDVAQLTFVASQGAIGTEVWVGQDVTVDAVGETGDVTFEIVTNGSGGSFASTDEAGGQAMWSPGSSTGTEDTLRVTDDSTGAEAELTLQIRPNPVANHIARFGTTDVWWINTDAKRGSHDFRTDFLQGLSDIGMLPATPASSTTEMALEAKVEATARRYMLRELNLIYLRNADGTRGSGLYASFPYSKPDAASHFAPVVSGSLAPNSTRYSVMELADYEFTGSPGVLGRAYLDPNNDTIEHDGGVTGGDTRLGVFVDRMINSFSSWQFSKLLTNNRVGVADAGIIDDMLYGQTVSGSRHSAIDTLLTYFARAFAQVVAHEVGHSISFDHTSDSDTLMSGMGAGFSNSDLGVSNGVPFTAAEVQAMRDGILPGPSRGGSSKPQAPANLGVAAEHDAPRFVEVYAR